MTTSLLEYHSPYVGGGFLTAPSSYRALSDDRARPPDRILPLLPARLLPAVGARLAAAQHQDSQAAFRTPQTTKEILPAAPGAGPRHLAQPGDRAVRGAGQGSVLVL